MQQSINTCYNQTKRKQAQRVLSLSGRDFKLRVEQRRHGRGLLPVVLTCQVHRHRQLLSPGRQISEGESPTEAFVE